MKKYLKTPEEVIDALQAGKKVETNELEYRFINGILVAISKTDKNWIVYPSLSSSVIPYTNESESFKLKVGKFYKTRDGRKVIISNIIDDPYNPYPVFVMAIGDTALYCVNRNGFFISEKDIRASDLVAPWKD